jgi:hypothetical protein
MENTSRRTPGSACVELCRGGIAVVDRHRVRSAVANGRRSLWIPERATTSPPAVSGEAAQHKPALEARARRLVPLLIAGLGACVGALPDDEMGSRADGGPPVDSGTVDGVSARWGRLASPSHDGDRIVATLFFSGEARDGSKRYEYESASNMELYTESPADPRQLHWSSEPATRHMVLDSMVETGVNVVHLSSWGPRGSPSWAQWAPMQTSTYSHDEFFSAVGNRPLLVVPFLESTPEWRFRSDFPGTAADPSPGLVLCLIDLVNRILLSPIDTSWPDKWALVYDRKGEARRAVAIIQASSDSDIDDQTYVDGLDRVADAVEEATGVKIGFFIDPMPPNTTAKGLFFPTAERTAEPMARSDSLLGVSPFLPEVWKKFGQDPNDGNRLEWKRRFIEAWANTKVPTLVDVSPGYDASLVFPDSERFGLTQFWLDTLRAQVVEFGQDGIVLNSWNGYTEAMSMIPTVERGDEVYRWAADLTALFAPE